MSRWFWCWYYIVTTWIGDVLSIAVERFRNRVR